MKLSMAKYMIISIWVHLFNNKKKPCHETNVIWNHFGFNLAFWIGGYTEKRKTKKRQKKLTQINKEEILEIY